jgi:FAD/FMN-containing dehydrogenase
MGYSGASPYQIFRCKHRQPVARSIVTVAIQPEWNQLASELEGELYFDDLMRTLYATDASVYREMPQTVALPKNEADICKLVRFAHKHRTSLIPRTAGTSLAGQVVGPGIVVDVSRHLNRILEIDPDRRRVRVQPGVIRNELNLALLHISSFSLLKRQPRTGR